MVSFEEKKVIFKSFQLKEKEISKGRINFIYPESKQKGQVLARELQQSGNGYVIGKYMQEKVIKDNGYRVDARGWISIKDCPKEELAKLITEAMKSMSGKIVEMVKVEEEVSAALLAEVQEVQVETALEVAENELSTEAEPNNTEAEAPAVQDTEKTEKQESQKTVAQDKQVDPYLEYESYPLSCWFAWVGLALSSMETGFLIWRNTIRKYGELRQK